ncbi:MAG: hypothetical protein CFH37_01473 [Alphaproteobacteria bacterium MarineAlpha9_Bin7]|nr:MAG: hypothetical protein CFH37_01473 [Alphaproteobacteria bacterium MarineAlpha9_Bin7]
MDGGSLRTVTLEDKYQLSRGRVFISGTQALVRLPIMQRERDAANGLNTAGFISGYRGSPIGGYDSALWAAKSYLEKHQIVFQPGLNEDLAATAIWGTQQLDFVPGRKVDGVFSIWYGKGPGVDRSGDPLKHLNYNGTHPNGGVLIVFGDDHPGKSSSIGHQSDPALAANSIPVLFPATIQEYLDFGLHGIAMSRFAGVVVGFKCVNETVTATATVAVDPDRVAIKLPQDMVLPEGGIHIRPEYDPLGQDERMVRYKLPRVLAYARNNRIDYAAFGSSRPTRLGIVTSGKAYLDCIGALHQLGIDDGRAREMGIGLYKVGMVWPVEPEGMKAFSANCDELLFVEEKRPLVEDQAKSILYAEERRPRIVGKFRVDGSPLLPSDHPLEAAAVANAIAERLESEGAVDEDLKSRHANVRNRINRNLPALDQGIARSPYFCSGCPHNTSTKVPDGSFALGGIGCHGMAVLMDRNTRSISQMGGEGVTWAGLAPFTETNHIYQNLGDGTYNHSGSLAIRASVQAGANITYKILYNDAVAMTGGQPVEGNMSVGQIAQQVKSEGVSRVVIVSDQPDKFRGAPDVPTEVSVHDREELDSIQKDLRDLEGTTVIIYEQTCAAEKRRRRKRGEFPNPPKRAFINSLVCEGCGDCSVKANCVSIHPLETEFGRKRVIDQSSCNKDYSCVDGFCPSFVTVHGGGIKRAEAAEVPADFFDSLPDPVQPVVENDWSVLIAGVGGTGVVTIGAVLGMAAHLEGKGSAIFDMTGVSQKNGAVYSHLKILQDPESMSSADVGFGEADLLLGCDLVAAVAPVSVRTIEPGKTRVVVNESLTPTPQFQTAPNMNLDGGLLLRGLEEHAGKQQMNTVSATQIALALTGDTIGANTFMIGYALQLGFLPLSVPAIERAIELNGVAVSFNLHAFRLGRLAVADPEGMAKLLPRDGEPVAQGIDSRIQQRVAFLASYQDIEYATRYQNLVERAREAEQQIDGNRDDFTNAIVKYAFKLMSYKDEYEVARLFTTGDFKQKLSKTFDGNYRLHFHLAPPLFARKNPQTGLPRKSEFGPWMFSVFKILARCKGLRGSRFDPFGWTTERRMERRLRDQYLSDMERLCEDLTLDNHSVAVELAEVPDQIRGFGHVKLAAVESAEHGRNVILDKLAAIKRQDRAA